MKLDAFLNLVATTLGMQSSAMITTDTELSENWDSLNQIAVMGILDTNFQVSLTMDELTSLRTLGDIVNVLKARGITLE